MTNKQTPIPRQYAGRTAEQRVGERRGRLLEAALQLYGTQGYASTSIEQLCSAAAISMRSFYQEMGSREKLLIALADDITGRATAAAFEQLAALSDAPFADRITAGFRAYLAVTCTDPRTARVCYIEVVGVSTAVEEWRGRWRSNIGALVQAEAEQAVARGQARDRDYRLFAIAVIGAVNSLAQELARGDREPEPQVTLPSICAEITSLVIAGVAPEPAAP